jgi:hypothetical protein
MIRCIAISPSSSPRYAFATFVASVNEPEIRPCPLLHSRTKAAEQVCGKSSRIYDPSVTATSVPSAIERCIHDSPPVMVRFSYSHVFPHDISTSRNVDGVLTCGAVGATDVRRKCSSLIVCSTKHTVLCFSRCRVCEKWNLFGFLPGQNTSSELVLRCSLCRVEVLSSHDQFHCRWVSAMNFPTLFALQLAGHIDCSAVFHRTKSESVGCSFGH